MSLVLTSGPAVEPVTLAEAKAHLRLDNTAEDLLITTLITTSRMHIESRLGIALNTQAWSLFIDRLPASHVIPVPLRPLSALNAVRIYADDNTISPLPLAAFELDGLSTPPRLIIRSGVAITSALRKSNAIEINVTAGFGPAPADVPAPIRQALLLLIAHWYEHRDPLEAGAATTRIPAVVADLLGPWHTPRLI